MSTCDDLFKGAFLKIFEVVLMLKPVLLGVEEETLLKNINLEFLEPENIDAFKKAVEEILKKDYINLQNSCRVSNQFDRDIR